MRYRIELVWPGTIFSPILAVTVEASNWKSAYALAKRAAESWAEGVKVLAVRRVR